MSRFPTAGYILSSLTVFLASWWVGQDIRIAAGTTAIYVAVLLLLLPVLRRLSRQQPSPAVVWLTGLSGSGKTTIAHALAEKLERRGIKPVLLDGDEIRNMIRLTGFDEQSRKQHNRTVGYIASLFEQKGHIVIVSLISPYGDVRDEIRGICRTFVEVYLSTPLEECIRRDPKGLYQKAMSGEIKEFTGISAPYHAPEKPELALNTAAETPENCVQRILTLLNTSK